MDEHALSSARPGPPNKDPMPTPEHSPRPAVFQKDFVDIKSIIFCFVDVYLVQKRIYFFQDILEYWRPAQPAAAEHERAPRPTAASARR